MQNEWENRAKEFCAFMPDNIKKQMKEDFIQYKIKAAIKKKNRLTGFFDWDALPCDIQEKILGDECRLRYIKEEINHIGLNVIEEWFSQLKNQEGKYMGFRMNIRKYNWAEVIFTMTNNKPLYLKNRLVQGYKTFIADNEKNIPTLKSLKEYSLNDKKKKAEEKLLTDKKYKDGDIVFNGWNILLISSSTKTQFRVWKLSGIVSDTAYELDYQNLSSITVKPYWEDNGVAWVRTTNISKSKMSSYWVIDKNIINFENCDNENNYIPFSSY
jgi:hypothetical protein